MHQLGWLGLLGGSCCCLPRFSVLLGCACLFSSGVCDCLICGASRVELCCIFLRFCVLLGIICLVVSALFSACLNLRLSVLLGCGLPIPSAFGVSCIFLVIAVPVINFFFW